MTDIRMADLILEEIGHDPAKCTDDLTQSLKASPAIHAKAQDRAVWILNTGMVNKWLSSLASQVMVINSCEDQGHGQLHTPVSLFSANLAQALLKSTSCVVLYWSCALNIHGDVRDATRDMLGQLLLNGDEHLPQTSIDKSSTKPKLKHPDDILELLMLLLEAQLMVSPVFVVVDSISFYEDRSRLPRTRSFFEELFQFADAWDGEYQLKVLTTSPTRCRFLGSRLAEWSPTVLEWVHFTSFVHLASANLAIAGCLRIQRDCVSVIRILCCL